VAPRPPPQEPRALWPWLVSKRVDEIEKLGCARDGKVDGAQRRRLPRRALRPLHRVRHSTELVALVRLGS
jgi:hypothetical protein